MISTPPDRLLSTSDVALLLGVVPSAVANWLKRGSGPLPAPDYTTGHSVYWKPETIAPIAAAERAKQIEKLRRMTKAAEVIL